MDETTQAKTVARKMGIRPGSRAFLSNVPPEVRSALNLPDLDRACELTGEFDYLHLFVFTRIDLNAALPRFRDRLRPGGMLWVSWPKGGQLGTDLSLHEVVRIGYGHGLVESTCLSVNDTWSALKFTWPKPGKVYRNSHAELNRHTT
ncbi:MAG TPA: hypothetical protein VNZ55_04195 [Thermomicrobiales bacterium]|nr:hypothetical protein [Thermomicrobiales bacterium]